MRSTEVGGALKVEVEGDVDLLTVGRNAHEVYAHALVAHVAGLAVGRRYRTDCYK